MFSAYFIPYPLRFAFSAGTSRGILNEKMSYFLIIKKDGKTGIGECSIIPRLSKDDRSDYVDKLEEICQEINKGKKYTELNLSEFPSIAFGLETAFLDLENGGTRELFTGPFTRGIRGIPINGLVWMGTIEQMQKQINKKLDTGFKCIKIKVGSLDFETELLLIKHLRNSYSTNDLEIRLDANGAFALDEAYNKLCRLSEYSIHSIEQPIQTCQWEAMADLCLKSPIPIALDEELIPVSELQEKETMLQTTKPKYIIIKPSLLGGFEKSEEWIKLAIENGIEWWATSALESNIGLNAIAQWVFHLNPVMVQGLGTGQIYSNNIQSPLKVENAKLWYKHNLTWDLKPLNCLT